MMTKMPAAVNLGAVQKKVTTALDNHQLCGSIAGAISGGSMQKAGKLQPHCSTLGRSYHLLPAQKDIFHRPETYKDGSEISPITPSRLRSMQKSGEIPTDLDIHNTSNMQLRMLLDMADEDFANLDDLQKKPLFQFYENCYVNRLLRGHVLKDDLEAKSLINQFGFRHGIQSLLKLYDSMPVYTGATRRVVDQSSFVGSSPWKPGDIYVDPGIMATEKPSSSFIEAPEQWKNLATGRPIIMHIKPGAMGVECGTSPEQYAKKFRNLHEVHYPPLLPFRVETIKTKNSITEVSLAPVSMSEAEEHKQRGGEFYSGKRQKFDLFASRAEFSDWFGLSEQWHVLSDVPECQRDPMWEALIQKV